MVKRFSFKKNSFFELFIILLLTRNQNLYTKARHTLQARRAQRKPDQTRLTK